MWLFSDASAAHSEAEDRFYRSGLDRLQRVIVGEYTPIVRSPSHEPIPLEEQVAQPVYFHDHAHIDHDCDADARSPNADLEKVEARRRRLHAELDANIAAIAAVKAKVDEAERLHDLLHDEWKAEALVLVEVAPTTVAGLLARIDRFEERTEGCMIGEDVDGLDQLLRHVRRFLAEARA